MSNQNHRTAKNKAKMDLLGKLFGGANIKEQQHQPSQNKRQQERDDDEDDLKGKNASAQHEHGHGFGKGGPGKPQSAGKHSGNEQPEQEQKDKLPDANGEKQEQQKWSIFTPFPLMAQHLDASLVHAIDQLPVKSKAREDARDIVTRFSHQQPLDINALAKDLMDVLEEMEDEHGQKPKNEPIIEEFDSDEEKKEFDIDEDEEKQINKKTKKTIVKKHRNSGRKVVSKRGNRQLVVRQQQQPAVLKTADGFGQQPQMLLSSTGIGLQPAAVQPVKYQQQSLQIAGPKTDDFQTIASQFNKSDISFQPLQAAQFQNHQMDVGGQLLKVEPTQYEGAIEKATAKSMSGWAEGAQAVAIHTAQQNHTVRTIVTKGNITERTRIVEGTKQNIAIIEGQVKLGSQAIGAHKEAQLKAIDANKAATLDTIKASKEIRLDQNQKLFELAQKKIEEDSKLNSQQMKHQCDLNKQYLDILQSNVKAQVDVVKTQMGHEKEMKEMEIQKEERTNAGLRRQIESHALKITNAESHHKEKMQSMAYAHEEMKMNFKLRLRQMDMAIGNRPDSANGASTSAAAQFGSERGTEEEDDTLTLDEEESVEDDENHQNIE